MLRIIVLSSTQGPEMEIIDVLVSLFERSVGTTTDIAVDGATSLVSWTISPATGPFGSEALLNGQALPRTIANGVAIKEIPVAGMRTEGGNKLSLPPISVTFAVVGGIPTPPECAQDKQPQ